MKRGAPVYDRATSAAGRLLLLRVLQRSTADAVAGRCRVDPSRLSRWALGQDRPCARARALLEHVYAIPASACGRAPVPQSEPGSV